MMLSTSMTKLYIAHVVVPMAANQQHIDAGRKVKIRCDVANQVVPSFYNLAGQIKGLSLSLALPLFVAAFALLVVLWFTRFGKPLLAFLAVIWLVTVLIRAGFVPVASGPC